MVVGFGEDDIQLPMQAVCLCHQSCEFKFCSWQGVLDTTLCDKVCQWLVTGYDHAILLTGLDICAFSDKPCDTLGRVFV
jgi:hypothetical protein